MKIASTPAAEAVVRRVKDAGRDNLVMVLGTGCWGLPPDWLTPDV
ncbi:MAG: hypothetical protein ABR548_14230 [Actinomycetota bacterium]